MQRKGCSSSGRTCLGDVKRGAMCGWKIIREWISLWGICNAHGWIRWYLGDIFIQAVLFIKHSINHFWPALFRMMLLSAVCIKSLREFLDGMRWCWLDVKCMDWYYNFADGPEAFEIFSSPARISFSIGPLFNETLSTKTCVYPPTAAGLSPSFANTPTS